MILRFFSVLFLLPVMLAGAEPGLRVEAGPSGKSYLSHGGEPLFAFGPGDEARMLSGGNDVDRWIKWQAGHGMNLVRAYPTSVPIDGWSPSALHPFERGDEGWDVDAWNEEYFENLAAVAARLEEAGIVLHLQLWQIVWFKGGSSRWEINYLNPANNVNEWTSGFERGRDYINAPADSAARAHQQEWVRRVLHAVKDRNNLIVDVINELGNEMGTIEWAAEVAGWIRDFEAEHGVGFIVGVDSEHHYHREGAFDPYTDVFDLLIFNELRSADFVRGPINHFNMPAVTVRSSDGRNRWSDYMFANEHQAGPEHQTRYRTLCYRSIFSGVQSVGAYWKMNVEEADYKAMEEWPRYAEALRSFWKIISPEWPALVPGEDFIAGETVTPHAYGMRSDALTAVYLECGSHSWNNDYPASSLTLEYTGPGPRVELFHPRTGEKIPAEAHIEDGLLSVSLPAFTDDIVVLVWAGE